MFRIFKECFMLKKYIIFGSVALLLAALFALTGCSQATDSDGGSVVYSENHLFGEADAAAVARAVESAKRTNRVVVLTNALEIRGTTGGNAAQPAVADFENMPVRVEGSVTVTGNVIVNGAHAALTFEDGASITVANGGAFIYNGVQDNIYTANPQGYKVKYVANPLEAAQGTDNRIAVPSYKLGADDVAPHITHLYVLDKVTVDALSPTPNGTAGNPNVIALGEVDLIETNALAFASIAVTPPGNTFVFAKSAVLSTSSPALVTIELPDAAPTLPTVAARTTPIAISFPNTGIAALVIDKIEGPQAVTINGGVITDLTIGEVAESGQVTVIGTSLADAEIEGNAGDITIAVPTISAGDVAIGSNSGKIAITGNTTFDNTVTIAANAGEIKLDTIAGAGLEGLVSIAGNTGSITLTAPVITGGANVASNSGDLTFAAPSITTTAISVTRNTSTGNIIFSKELTLDDNGGAVDNLLKVPANYGNVRFLGDVTIDGEIGSAGTANDKIAGVGKVIFGNDVTFNAATIIECDTVFNGNVGRDDVALTFGDVTLDYGLGITLTGTAGFTLGKRLLVGGGVTPVLAGPVTITPVTTAVLAAGEANPDPADFEYVDDRTLFLDGADITSFTGNLKVLGGGILNFGPDANDIGITGTSSLTLESGAILAFPDLATGKTVTLGDTKITGAGTASQLIADNGAVTFSVDTISGNGSSLRIVEDIGSASIVVSGASVVLNIEKVNIDLSANGSLDIAPDASAARVILVASTTIPGKITLSEDSMANTITRNFNNVIAGDGTLTGSGVIHADDTAGTAVGVGDLIGGAGSNLTIRGDITNQVSLSNGTSISL
jgi:hypothetical protein